MTDWFNQLPLDPNFREDSIDLSPFWQVLYRPRDSQNNHHQQQQPTTTKNVYYNNKKFVAITLESLQQFMQRVAIKFKVIGLYYKKNFIAINFKYLITILI